MNKTLRITLICIAAAVAVWAAGHIVIDHVAQNRIRKALADIPGARVQFKDLDFSLVGGNLGLSDVEFELSDPEGLRPDIHTRIAAIKLEGLRWRSLFRGEASARRLLIRSPRVRVMLTGSPVPRKDSTPVSADASFLKKISLAQLRVEKGDVVLTSLQDSARVSAQAIDICLRDIGVQLPEGTLEYNDSQYSFSADSLDVTDNLGLSRVRVGRLSTADAGPVEALSLHLYSCVPQEEVAERLGKVAALWYDVRLDSLYTSPVGIPAIIRDGRIAMESVHLSGPGAVIFQDDRYLPAVPYATIQEGINAVQMPLQIGQLEASLDDFTFIWETTHINRGTLPLSGVRMSVSSVSNAPDNVMKATVKTGLGGSSSMDFSLSVRNDRAETTSGTILAKGVDLSRLDAFVRPLFGATAWADVHQIDFSFQGNKYRMRGTYCMQYENLGVKVWKDATAPYQVVSKNSGVINFVANLALPKSNPSRAGKQPKRVEVDFERDAMQPYPAYFIAGMGHGALHTFIPGGSVRKARKK